MCVSACVLYGTFVETREQFQTPPCQSGIEPSSPGLMACFTI